MKEQNDNDLNVSEYAKRLKDYATPPDPQKANEAFTDGQLNSLTMSITHVIDKHNRGTILDIGCGSGIVLTRIAGITEFKDKDGWGYLGVGNVKDRSATKKTAVDLEEEFDFDIDKRFKCRLLDEFYSDWISNAAQPLLVIIRNVFHELDIFKTAKLIYTLTSNLTDKDTLFIQDLELFPKQERDNACWIPDMFKVLLESCGFSSKVTPCETSSGNKYFNVEAERDISISLSYDEIVENVTKRRQGQFSYMTTVNDNLGKIKGNRDEKIAILDFDLQYKALAVQLEQIKNKVKSGAAKQLHIPASYKTWLKTRCLEMDIGQLVGDATEKGLFTINMPEIYIPLYAANYATITSHSDGSSNIEKNINIEKFAVQKDCLVVAGQPGSGKTTLIKHLAYTILQQKNDCGFKDYLPLFIILNDLQIAIKNMEQADRDKIIPGVPFAKKIMSKYFEETGNGLNLEIVESYAERGKLILLVDGLDEMENEVRAQVILSLVDFRNKYKDNIKIVLTGRPAGIDYQVREKYKNDNHVTIDNLNNSQINEFLTKWFDHIPAMAEKGLTVKGIEEEIQSHEHIKALIETPLMLTAICVLYYNGGKIPDQRAELYEKFINNLLFKRFEKEDAKNVQKFLMRLAYKVHRRSNHEERNRYFDKNIGIKALSEVHPEDKPEELEEKFNMIVQRCGLLKEEDHKYLFWHLSFQEFLTARHLNTLSAIKEESVANYWQNSWYKEVIRLFIGYLYCNNDGSSANAVVKSGVSLEESSPYSGWLLASQSLSDIPVDDRDIGVLKLVRKKLNHIIGKVADLKIMVEAGETLGWLGDPRDLKEFIPVEGGDYYLISFGRYVPIDPFNISKYPVTNSWYEEFMNDDGYTTKENWSEEGIKWLEDTKTKHPKYWNGHKWICPNSPVVGVCWYEAEAFTKWLNSEQNSGNSYRLPNEKEFEAAAGGKKGRKYPWGDEWDKYKCNNKTGIHRTSPVGIFNSGNTSGSVSDLSGNVWELCIDRYDKNASHRVLRGGGWDRDDQGCSSAFRISCSPGYRSDAIGFRLVFVP